MAFELLGSTSKPAKVLELIARKTYNEAFEILQGEQAEGSPRDAALQILTADVLVLQGKIEEATRILEQVADYFAQRRLAAQAIAVLKKVQKLDPSRADLDSRIVELYKAGPASTPTVEEPMPEEPEEPQREPHRRREKSTAPTLTPAAPARLPDANDAEILASIADGVDIDHLLAYGAGDAVSNLPRTSSLLFDDFSEEEFLEVVRGLELLTFEAGDILMTEGEEGQTLYVLTSGTAKAFVRNRDGGSTQVRQLQEGDFFGEIAMLSGSRRTATITAATRCELLRLERNTLEAITARHPRVKEILLRFYEERANNAAEAEIRGLDPGSAETSGQAAIPQETSAAGERASGGPSRLQYLRRIAVEQSQKQNWPDAVIAWQQYTTLQPDDLDAATSLALLYGKLGRWLDAARSFERLVARTSTDPTLFFNLGISYRQLELLPQAAGAYRQALTIKPDYEKARLALASVMALMTRWKVEGRS